MVPATSSTRPARRFEKGMSGGLVVDLQGAVVGLVSYQLVSR
jgi:hypothetical protein